MDEYLNAPILVSDAMDMYLRNEELPDIPENNLRAIKYNNKFLKSFVEPSLKDFSDNDGKIPANDAYEWISVILEGFDTLEFVKYDSELTQTTDKNILERWLKIFESFNTEQLMKIGLFTLNQGWFLVNCELKKSLARQKYKQFYSKSSDPRDWIRLYIQQKQGKTKIPVAFPFWDSEKYRKIAMKVGAIVNFPLEPAK